MSVLIEVSVGCCRGKIFCCRVWILFWKLRGIYWKILNGKDFFDSNVESINLEVRKIVVNYLYFREVMTVWIKIVGMEGEEVFLVIRWDGGGDGGKEKEVKVLDLEFNLEMEFRSRMLGCGGVMNLIL